MHFQRTHQPGKQVSLEPKSACRASLQDPRTVHVLGGQTIVRAVERKEGQAEQGISGLCVDNNDGNTEGPECGAKKQSEALPGVSINNITSDQV